VVKNARETTVDELEIVVVQNWMTELLGAGSR
jgi:hypothetical protein